MADAAPIPAAYAPPSPGDKVERQLLASLAFVGRKQAEFCLDPVHSIEKVRSEINRVYRASDQMPALNAKILAGAQPAARYAQPSMAAAPKHTAAPSTSAAAIAAKILVAEARDRSARLEEIQQRMGTAAWAPNAKLGVAWDPQKSVQTFGVGVAQ